MLQQYRSMIVAIRGEDNVGADYLSLEVVSHLSHTCIYVVYIYSILFLLFYIVRKSHSFFSQKEGICYDVECQEHQNH